MASTSEAAAFYATFQQLKAETSDALSTGPTTAAPKLAALRAALAAARPALPPYDQRSYDLQVRELETRLAGLRADKPKSRFAFKRAAASGASGPSSRAQSASPAPASGSGTPPAAAPTTTAASSSAPSPVPATTYTLAKHSNRTLSPDDYAAAGESYTLTLSDLDSCVVDLRSARALTSLHARGLRDCVVLAPVMGGSAMLSDLQGCVVALGAQQFRLHDASGCALLLHVASLPVVERCRGVRFGAYPFPAEGGSKHEQVQDFDWVRPGPSPHWSLLSPGHAAALTAALQSSPTPSAPQLLALDT